MELLIVGIGNETRGDDAAGLMVARRLRELLGLPDEQSVQSVTVVESDGECTRLLDLWQQAPYVIVIDAVRSGAAPGTISAIDPTNQPLPPGLACSSSHALGLREAVELARQLGLLPARLVIYGIEAVTFTIGTGLAPPVERAVAELAARVCSEVAACTCMCSPLRSGGGDAIVEPDLLS